MTRRQDEARAIERHQRLSRSIVWSLQRKFFEQRGIEAWSQAIVPHYVTSNPYLAGAYVEVVIGWLRDALASTDTDTGKPVIDLSRPLYVVELGSGSGRFAYVFLKKLLENLERLRLFPVDVKYIVTDLAEKNLEFLRRHPRFEPLLASGHVDFARFDAGTDQGFELLCSGEILTAGEMGNPIVAIANYVFDGLPNDCFVVYQGQLYENLVTVSVPDPGADLDDPSLLEQIKVTYEPFAAAAAYYGDPDLDQLLADHQDLDDSIFLFPLATLQALRSLERLAAGRLLLLSADKGHGRKDEVGGRGLPGMSRHGSISMMVNYPAIARYVESRGGEALIPRQKHSSLLISAYLLGVPAAGYVEARHAFQRAIEEHNPDDFYTLTKALEEQVESLDLRQILAHVRLSGWDWKLILVSFQRLLTLIGTASPDELAELRVAINRVWEYYLPLAEKVDLPTCLGLLLYEMGDSPGALNFFEQALEIYAASALAQYNIALCHHQLGDIDEALRSIDRALAIDPLFKAAGMLRIRLQIERTGGPTGDFFPAFRPPVLGTTVDQMRQD